MAVLLVTYELKDASKDYTPFFNALKSAGQWWHYLDNVWLVDTQMGANALANNLYPHMLKTDRLLVTKLAGDSQGWLANDAWTWINQRGY